jgi:predicted transposase/invertase (TIGR01784 family)
MSRSQSLADYAAIMAKIREGQENGQSLEEAIKNAVLFGIENGIMEDFLRKYRSEVLNMLTTEFNLDDALAVRFEEGREEGWGKGREEGREEGMEKVARTMLARRMPIRDIVDITGLNERDVLSLQ